MPIIRKEVVCYRCNTTVKLRFSGGFADEDFYRHSSKVPELDMFCRKENAYVCRACADKVWKIKKWGCEPKQGQPRTLYHKWVRHPWNINWLMEDETLRESVKYGNVPIEIFTCESSGCGFDEIDTYLQEESMNPVNCVDSCDGSRYILPASDAFAQQLSKGGYLDDVLGNSENIKTKDIALLDLIEEGSDIYRAYDNKCFTLTKIGHSSCVITSKSDNEKYDSISKKDLEYNFRISTGIMWGINETKNAVSVQMMKDAILRNEGNVTKTANELQISRQGLYKKLKANGIDHTGIFMGEFATIESSLDEGVV